MKSLTQFIVKAWENKHTSTSALFLFGASVVGIIWPKYKSQADEVARAAIVYGLIAAGDARLSQPTKNP